MPVLNSLEVYTTNEPDLWDKVLDEIGECDYFHLAAFHKWAEMRGEGEAVMPVYREGDYVIAFPLLLREINIPSSEHSDKKMKDATCVNGLVGPVTSSKDVPESIINHFQQYMQDFFEQNQILTVFSRLNPFIDHSHLLDGYGEIIERGILLAIDLTPPPDVQFRNYKKNRREEIRRLKRLGLTCEKVGIEHLDDFIRIYQETMDRVDAEASYYFDREYFEYLMRDLAANTHIFICKDRDTIISSILATECKGIIQMYLGGTINNYVPLSPSKVLYDYIREWGNEIGGRLIQVGGGHNGSRDQLYTFKMGFGCKEYVYHTWRHTVNAQDYEALCSRVWDQANIEPDNSFFPMYRHPALQCNKS